MQKNNPILLALLGSICLLIIACTPSTKNTAQQHTDSTTISTKTPQNQADTDTFIGLAERLTKASLKYNFKETESYDRCNSIAMTDKSGKKIELPKIGRAHV